MAGAPADFKGSVLAGLKAEQNRVLGQSKCLKLEGIDDAAEYAETGALEKLGVPAESVKEPSRCSALLLIGNTQMIMDDNDKADIDGSTEAMLKSGRS